MYALSEYKRRLSRYEKAREFILSALSIVNYEGATAEAYRGEKVLLENLSSEMITWQGEIEQIINITRDGIDAYTG